MHALGEGLPVFGGGFPTAAKADNAVSFVGIYAHGGEDVTRGFLATGAGATGGDGKSGLCLLYTSPSPRDRQKSRMPSSA